MSPGLFGLTLQPLSEVSPGFGFLGFNCLTLQPLVKVSPELVWFDSSTSCRSESGFGFLFLSSEILSLLLRRMILECQLYTNFSWKGGKLNGKFLNIARKIGQPEVVEEEQGFASEFNFLTQIL